MVVKVSDIKTEAEFLCCVYSGSFAEIHTPPVSWVVFYGISM